MLRLILGPSPSTGFGESWAFIDGVKLKVHYFVLALPHSDACFVKAYPRETTEAFCDGHVSAFGFLGGVPLSIVYDNTTIAVAQIMMDGERVLTETFAKLQSHYVFQEKFGRPGKGNDKGTVEGLVGYIRRNSLIPIPRLVSVRKVLESYESDVIQGSYRRMEGKANVDIRKPRFL
jgi:transposase